MAEKSASRTHGDFIFRLHRAVAVLKLRHSQVLCDGYARPITTTESVEISTNS